MKLWMRIENIVCSPDMYKNIFDTHAHYEDEQFDCDRDELLSSFPENGISGVVTCGTDIITSEKSIADRKSVV